MIQLVPIVLSQIALMAGGPVTVQCSWKPPLDAAGIAYKTERRIVLEDHICRNANRFSRHPVMNEDNEVWSGTDASRAWALVIIAHEANHIAHPDYTEAQTNCAALSAVPGFAMALGASQETAMRARRIARMWIHDEDPPEYQSACTRG